MENEKHLIKSFDDLCDLVSDENIENLSVDLANWLISYHASIKLIREKMPKETAGKKNTEIAKSHFTWIDDGKNEILGVNFTKE